MYRSTIMLGVLMLGVLMLGVLAAMVAGHAHARGGAPLVPAYYQPSVRGPAVNEGLFAYCREMAQRTIVYVRRDYGRRIVQRTDYCVQNGGRL